MVKEAIQKGKFNPATMILLDATSGNTGIAFAMIGAALSFKVELCLPKNASEERKKILVAYGAKVIETDPIEGSDGAILKARALYKAERARYFYPDQYSNPDNWRAHYETTGPEIWEQTEGAVTHFVTGLGTSGTFVGVGRFLKERNSKIKIFSMEPDRPFHGLEGLKHLASSLVPEIYDDIADEKIYVATEKAQDMALFMARHQGMFIGPSGGANLVAAFELARSIQKGVLVTILPDSGFLYLSENFWKDRHAALPDHSN